MTKNKEETYFAHGKLLLTGEYVVLDGAKAIGLPSKLGQHLTVSTLDDKPGSIFWSAKLVDGSVWFQAEISVIDFSTIETNNIEKASVIASILRVIKELNPGAFSNEKGYSFETSLDFPHDWGLGSSSTLLVLLSKFAHINAFELSEKTFGGSGYDISCAMMPKTQFYQLYKNQRKVNFVQLPSFVKENTYFVYLNQKQNSREGIAQYKNIPLSKSLIKSITAISEEIVKSPDLYEFEDHLFVHEALISDHLGIPTIQQSFFPDYQEGVIKSLGAWGGDFILVTAEQRKSLSYFQKKGFDTILSWKEIIQD
ncbi:GHMP kinase [Flavobacteriaceae bacterium Ap0902]|nr:GHMP kinase [Flavobacteriaceae bacterium Ap0902]